MSNERGQLQDKPTNAANTGTAPSTTPSVGKMAKNLSPDQNPWERQPGESKPAYDAFIAFRDDEKRRVGGKGTNAYAWSAEWSWGYRAFEWDQYLARQDAEEMVRYRRVMNERHRRAATLAQQKVIAWLIALDPSKLTATEAARWLEVAVKIERLAGGGDTERIAVRGQGPIENLTAEEVNEALQGLIAEINRVANP